MSQFGNSAQHPQSHQTTQRPIPSLLSCTLSASHISLPPCIPFALVIANVYSMALPCQAACLHCWWRSACTELTDAPREQLARKVESVRDMMFGDSRPKPFHTNLRAERLARFFSHSEKWRTPKSKTRLSKMTSTTRDTSARDATEFLFIPR